MPLFKFPALAAQSIRANCYAFINKTNDNADDMLQRIKKGDETWSLWSLKIILPKAVLRSYGFICQLLKTKTNTRKREQVKYLHRICFHENSAYYCTDFSWDINR